MADPVDLEAVARRVPEAHTSDCCVAVLNDDPCLCGGMILISRAELAAYEQVRRELRAAWQTIAKVREWAILDCDDGGGDCLICDGEWTGTTEDHADDCPLAPTGGKAEPPR